MGQLPNKTPYYHYDLALLQRTLTSCKTAANKYGFHIHYALKANANNRILDIIKANGFGADCVSGNEVKKALEIGFDPQDIAFAGVGKSDEEILVGLQNDIFCFNVESIPELEVINELAVREGKKARIALRLNPNVNAHTHHYITTGLEENKFGINQWELSQVVELLPTLSNIECIGLHFHIGSQITDLNVFKSLCMRVNEFQNWFAERGFIFKHLNVGGGLGINYQQPNEYPVPDFEEYFAVFNQFITKYPQQLIHFELGRALVAQCGSLITKVLYIKKGLKTNFAIVDAGMTELLRPALYQAYHKIEVISRKTLVDSEKDLGLSTYDLRLIKYDVVGPICESSDCFGKAVELPFIQRGDYLTIRSAGAYGEVMSSKYNLREQNEVVFEG